MSTQLPIANQPAPAAPTPQFQSVVLTLSDGRKGFFTGPVLARPNEIRILNLQLQGLVFSEPGQIIPAHSLPLLLECIGLLKGAAEVFEQRPTPGNAKLMTAAQERVFEVVEGIEAAVSTSATAPAHNG